jgi:hypothetical protein
MAGSNARHRSSRPCWMVRRSPCQWFQDGREGDGPGNGEQTLTQIVLEWRRDGLAGGGWIVIFTGQIDGRSHAPRSQHGFLHLPPAEASSIQKVSGVD